MATIINNPGDRGDSSDGSGLIVGILFAIVLIALFFLYVLPALRSSNAGPDTINVNVEEPSQGPNDNRPGQAGSTSPQQNNSVGASST